MKSGLLSLFYPLLIDKARYFEMAIVIKIIFMLNYKYCDVVRLGGGILSSNNISRIIRLWIVWL